LKGSAGKSGSEKSRMPSRDVQKKPAEQQETREGVGRRLTRSLTLGTTGLRTKTEWVNVNVGTSAPERTRYKLAVGMLCSGSRELEPGVETKVK